MDTFEYAEVRAVLLPLAVLGLGQLNRAPELLQEARLASQEVVALAEMCQEQASQLAGRALTGDGSRDKRAYEFRWGVGQVRR